MYKLKLNQMLAYVLLYFLGKSFYNLAVKHGKNGWGYAIMGVASYYGGIFLFGIIIVVLIGLFKPDLLETFSERELSFIALPFGLFTCWLLYQFTKRQFEQQPMESQSDILDDDFLK